MKFRTTQNILMLGIVAGSAFVVAGCGGGSSTLVSGPTNTVSGTSKQTSSAATTAVTVPATGGATQSITVGTGTVAAVIPSGTATPVVPGTQLAVVNSGSTLLTGSFTANTSVTVNGVSNSGVTVDSTGAISQNVALPIDPTSGSAYEFDLPVGTLQSRGLASKKTTFSGRFYITGTGIVSPFPTNVTGKIPNNGENAKGSTVTTTFGPGNNGRTVRLTVDYGNGFVLDQTQTIASNTVTFQNFATDASNIPATGVASITVAVGDLK